MKADFVQTMKILVFCEAVAFFVCCGGYQENPNIPDLIETFLKNKETSWRLTNTTQIKSSEKSVKSIKIEVLSTYVLSRSKDKQKHVDCSEILRNDPNKKNQDGVFTIYPDHSNGKKVFCDMTTNGGGWTVIQKRVDGSTGFYKTWKEYREGFGNAYHNYWIGNDVIHQLTKDSPAKLRVDLQRFSGEKGHAEYSKFAVSDENSKYKLTVSGYSGNIGDEFSYHNQMMFSTKNHDNDAYGGSCAQLYHGGWWYNSCHYTNLNGLYAPSALNDSKYNCWGYWKGNYEALKTTQMMIRP